MQLAYPRGSIYFSRELHPSVSRGSLLPYFSAREFRNHVSICSSFPSLRKEEEKDASKDSDSCNGANDNTCYRATTQT
jgi:hypothetical protein